MFEDYYSANQLSNESLNNISWIGSLQLCLILLVGCVSGPLCDAGVSTRSLLIHVFIIIIEYHSILSIWLDLGDSYSFSAWWWLRFLRVSLNFLPVNQLEPLKCTAYYQYILSQGVGVGVGVVDVRCFWKQLLNLPSACTRLPIHSWHGRPNSSLQTSSDSDFWNICCWCINRRCDTSHCFAETFRGSGICLGSTHT